MTIQTVTVRRDEGPRPSLVLGGVDIGFSLRKRTAGICYLSGEKFSLTCWFGREVHGELGRLGDFDLIAIDGPMLPRRSLDVALIRPVERLFSTGLFQRRCKPGMSHVPGTGIRLRETADLAAEFASDLTSGPRVTCSFPRVRDGAIVEAFPNAFLGVCLGDGTFGNMPVLRRGKKFDWLYCQWKENRLLERFRDVLGVREPFDLEAMFNRIKHHEHRAALVCILTALFVSRGLFTAVGEANGG
jgi:hypothetical protein